MKKLTIAIPTYNRQVLLEKLVNSIPSHLEISISDNGKYLTNEFTNKYQNVYLIQHEIIIDIFYNWNSSIKNIKDSDYIAIPSDDDLYATDSFRFIQDTIDSNENIDLFIFGNNFIDGNDEIIGQYCPEEYKIYEAPFGLKEFLYSVDARMPSVFFRKSFLDKIGYFDEEKFTLTAADSELIQRALLLGKVAFIPKIVSSYRVWPGSLTDQKIATKHWMDEIDIWTDKITTIANDTLTKLQNTFDWDKYKDEIFARNLLAGMNNLYKNKYYKKVGEHFFTTRYPRNAMIMTKLRILKILMFAKIKAFFAA